MRVADLLYTSDLDDQSATANAKSRDTSRFQASYKELIEQIGTRASERAPLTSTVPVARAAVEGSYIRVRLQCFCLSAGKRLSEQKPGVVEFHEQHSYRPDKRQLHLVHFQVPRLVIQPAGPPPKVSASRQQWC